MIFPDWAKKEEAKLINDYLKLPEDTRGDLEEYVYSNSSKKLTEVRNQCIAEEEKALTQGWIIN